MNKIMLVDDSDADNFIHTRVLKKADVAHNIIVKNSGQAALDYLSTLGDNGTFPAPELIFLDINMPGMNGWEFLVHYEKMLQEHKGEIVVCMLTTSTSTSDIKKADEVPVIEVFLHKPLTEAMVNSIITQYFPGRI